MRIVQTWRPANWPAGVHSLVRFELSPEGTGTRLSLDHDAVAEDQLPHIESGWTRMYWQPLAKYFAP